MTSDEELREALWERGLVDAGAEAYHNHHRRKKAITDTSIGERLIQDLAPLLVEKITDRQIEASLSLLEQKGSKLGWQYLLPMIDPEVASIVTLRCFLSRLTRRRVCSERSVLTSLAETYVQEIRFQRWMDSDRRATARWLTWNQQRLSTKGATARSMLKKRLESKISEFLDQPDGRAMLSLGSLLLSIVEDSLGEEMITRSRNPAKRRSFGHDSNLSLSESMLSNIALMEDLAARARPTLRPMLVPPVPWHRDERGRLRGGYLTIPIKLARSDERLRHRFDPSQAVLDAINAIQETPWAINERVLDWLSAHPEVGPEDPQHLIPQQMARDEFQALSDAERAAFLSELDDARNAYTSKLSQLVAFRGKVAIAESLRDRAPFFQPHRFDFRGRLYPINVELTSQGDHWAKGLLKFYHGKPLGADGLRALKIHTANCWGFDKLSIDERVELVDSRIDELRGLRVPGKSSVSLVLSADEPLTFLAAAWELVDALDSPDPAAFVSHIPVAVDGTCNGLQILSLLGHDEVGAMKTNCTSSDRRFDVYMEVADKVAHTIETILQNCDSLDESDEVAAAYAWHETMLDPARARRVVKRAIMTTPYGVTQLGIRDQLINDRHCDDLEIPPRFLKDGRTVRQARRQLARHMTDFIVQARSESVGSATQIMRYLRDCAGRLAKQGYPLSWVTPDGAEISQGYVKLKIQWVRTFDDHSRRRQVPTDSFDPRKSSGASAPNVVHSLDACMLRQVALRLREEGITDFSFIHDSYGVHACHAVRLGEVLRQVAVELFEGDWLRDAFHEPLTRLCASAQLPQPPPQGTLQVESELPKAAYFFS